MHQPDDEAPQQIVKEIHHYNSGTGGDGHRLSFGRVIDVLIPLSIAALVGVVWMLSNSVTKLTEQVSAQAQIQALQLSALEKQVSAVETKLEKAAGP